MAKVLIHQGDCQLLYCSDGDSQLLYCADGECGIFYPVSASDIEIYTGEYRVIPKVDEQYLYTKNKKMLDDVTVEEIPYHAVSNQFNGLTVTIGG